MLGGGQASSGFFFSMREWGMASTCGLVRVGSEWGISMEGQSRAGNFSLFQEFGWVLDPQMALVSHPVVPTRTTMALREMGRIGVI